MSNSSVNLLENVPLEPLPTNGKEYPLCTGFQGTPYAGSLFIYSGTEFETLRESLDGVFSFVYYYQAREKNHFATPADFLDTLWYKGLKIYIEFVHDPVGTVERGGPACSAFLSQFVKPNGTLFGDKQEQEAIKQALETPPLTTSDVERFLKWGVVIYTDAKTQTILRGLFPSREYPKLVLAVVNWPFYSIESGICEQTIMRCMRFQSAELFQGKTICVRDADTIFVNSLREYEQHPEYITYMILWWETEFLKPWITEYNYRIQETVKETLENRHIIEYAQCIIGTASWYQKDWHTNLPFKFPVSEKTQYYKFYAPDSTFSTKGVFAGFVNISKAVHAPVWKACVQYLVDRYFIGTVYGSQRVISDEYCKTLIGPKVGKDERLLLFVFPAHFNQYSLEYYPIEYSAAHWRAPIQVDAPYWPSQFLNSQRGRHVILEHLLTPYYNKGVYETKVLLITDSLKEDMTKRFTKYQEYLQKLNVSKETLRLTEMLEQCNPKVAKEDLLLKEAGILPQALFEEQLQAPVMSKESLQNTLKQKKAKMPMYQYLPPAPVPISQLVGGRRGRTKKRVKAQRRRGETRKA
jgi:hypothetical protein